MKYAEQDLKEICEITELFGYIRANNYSDGSNWIEIDSKIEEVRSKVMHFILKDRS